MTVMRTERGLDRLVNFSDATVAIAITLLVLPLVSAAGEISGKTLGQFWDENLWEITAFVISFAVIARFWVVHHRIFESVREYSLLMMWINFLWLLAIVAIPFTANLLSVSKGDRPDVYALYIGDLLLATVSSMLIGVVLGTHPELMTEEGRAARDGTRGIAEVVIMALALVLAVVIPAIGLWWLLLLWLADPLHRLLRRAVEGRRPTGLPRDRDEG
jgi:uncharacterized membrane protein